MIRTRFAPSPTGFLHLGNIRSALYPWAFARHHGGAFILRIEDTDTERSTPEAVQAIVEGMAWLGLDYDEGPYYQMQQMDRYRAVIGDMVARGLAYRCYLSHEELEALRAAQMARGEKPRYDGRWRPMPGKALPDPPAGVAPVIRFANPIGGSVTWDDAVKGRIEIANDELDDLVVARPDGTPTYNFCVVVDDLEMRITHVIRGDDHVNNTPRQINILRALGAEPPVYAHLPTVLTPEGEKLSKRHGARGILQYRDDGYLPDAIVNYLARLGWSHGDDEVFSREQFVAWFGLEALSPSPGRFDPGKLRWLNHEYVKRADAALLGGLLDDQLRRRGIDATTGPSPADLALLYRERCATLAEMADAVGYFYARPEVAPAALSEQLTDANRPAIADLQQTLAAIDWTREALATALKGAAQKHGLKVAQVMMPLRLMVAGTLSTPSLDAVLTLLRREATLARIAAGLSV